MWVSTPAAPLLREHGRGRPRAQPAACGPHAVKGAPVGAAPAQWRLKPPPFDRGPLPCQTAPARGGSDGDGSPPGWPGAQALWPSGFCSGLSNGDGSKYRKSADRTAAGYPDVATQFMASATLWKTATASQNGMSEQALPVSVSLRSYREREAETGQGVEPELIAVNGFYYRPFAVSVAR